MAKKPTNDFFNALKSKVHAYSPEEISQLFSLVDRGRVDALAAELCKYIKVNLPNAFEKRNGLADYRTNPYVLMTAASATKLDDPKRFAKFLFDSKLYMALETSFGKSIEAAFVKPYPIASEAKWIDAPEKVAEFAALEGLSREQKAQARVTSVWREIDKSVVVGKRRYLTSIKSGPNTINDTQVQGMTQAIISHYKAWLAQTKVTYRGVEEIDVVLGLTYGTDKTTNNKENQILVKLLDYGFEEEDRANKPGVLIDSETRSVRVYRRIGREFWDFIGTPEDQGASPFIFLEVLLGLARGLSLCIATADLETRINNKMRQLGDALANMTFDANSLPAWARDFGEAELFWFTTALSAFYDEGI